MNNEPISGLSKKKSRKVRKIAELVADEFSITIEEIYRKSNSPKFTVPRAIAMLLIHNCLKVQYEIIADLFNYANHSAVLSACRRMDTRISVDDDLKDAILDVLKEYNKYKKS